MFALFCIVDICKLFCVYVKGVLLNEDLMMIFLVRAYCKNLGINSLPRDFSPSSRERFLVSHRKLFTLNSVRKISYS